MIYLEPRHDLCFGKDTIGWWLVVQNRGHDLVLGIYIYIYRYNITSEKRDGVLNPPGETGERKRGLTSPTHRLTARKQNCAGDEPLTKDGDGQVQVLLERVRECRGEGPTSRHGDGGRPDPSVFRRSFNWVMIDGR